MADSIKKNFIYNILLNISKVIFPLITAPYVSRVLEPDGVGLFNFANTYANWFALFAALGIPFYGIREIAKIKDDIKQQTKLVSEIISISVLSTIICTAFLFLSLMVVPQLNENYIVFLVASIVLYFTPLRIDWFFQGKEEFAYITFRSLLIKTISLFLLFFLVRTKEDLLLYVALYAVSVVANDLWNFIRLITTGIHPYFTFKVRKHVKTLLLLLSSSIALYVYTALDTLMLGFMADYSEVGYYNCATHISKAMVPIVTSLAAVALPRITQYKNDNLWKEMNELLNKSFSIAGFLSFPLAFGIITVAPTFVPLFYGDQFYGSILPLQIIAITIVAIGYSNITGIQILLGFGLDKYFLFSILAGTMTSFTVNMMLIPLYGAVGASISSVCAEIMVLVFMLFYISKHTNIIFLWKKEIFQNLLIVLSFFVISKIVFRYIDGWFGIFVCIALCTVVYLILQRFCHNAAEGEIIYLLKKKLKTSKEI